MQNKTDPSERLSVVLSVKVTPLEKATWLEKAHLAGLTPSALFRKSVLESRVNIVALPRTAIDAVKYLHLYLRVVYTVERIAEPARIMLTKGTLSHHDYLVLLCRLDSVVQLFREGLQDAD